MSTFTKPAGSGSSSAGAQHDAITVRERAIARLKKRHDFFGHLLVYVLFNSFFVAIWVVTSGGGFFWPIFPMVAWGIGVVMNAWDVWRGGEFSEQQIEREIRRLGARR